MEENQKQERRKEGGLVNKAVWGLVRATAGGALGVMYVEKCMYADHPTGIFDPRWDDYLSAEIFVPLIAGGVLAFGPPIVKSLVKRAVNYFGQEGPPSFRSP